MQDNFDRYHRQMLIDEIGVEGQKRLKQAKVIVIGAGGLGSPVLMYLAAAGIGTIGIVDGDVVSESNLNRQVLYGHGDIGFPKADKAKDRIHLINDLVEINSYNTMLMDDNAGSIVRGYDLAIFCLDSIKSRKIANRACITEGIPFVEAGINSFYGIMTTVIPGITPCYECIFGESVNTEQTIPVLGAMAGVVGSMQALAAVRLLIGLHEPSVGHLIMINGNYINEAIKIERNIECKACRELENG